jgi:hypothetical protein
MAETCTMKDYAHEQRKPGERVLQTGAPTFFRSTVSGSEIPVMTFIPVTVTRTDGKMMGEMCFKTVSGPIREEKPSHA